MDTNIQPRSSDTLSLTTNLRTAVQQQSLSIKPIDNPDNTSEVIILNAIVNLISDNRGLLTAADITAEQIRNAAKQIGNQVIDSIKSKYKSTNQVDAEDIRISLVLAIADYFKSTNNSTLNTDISTAIDDIIKSYDKVTLELIADAFNDIDQLILSTNDPNIEVNFKLLDSASASKFSNTLAKPLIELTKIFEKTIDAHSLLVNKAAKKINGKNEKVAIDLETTRKALKTEEPKNELPATVPVVPPTEDSPPQAENVSKSEDLDKQTSTVESFVKQLKVANVWTDITMKSVLTRLTNINKQSIKTLSVIDKQLPKPNVAYTKTRKILDIKPTTVGKPIIADESKSEITKSATALSLWIIAASALFLGLAKISENVIVAAARTGRIIHKLWHSKLLLFKGVKSAIYSHKLKAALNLRRLLKSYGAIKTASVVKKYTHILNKLRHTKTVGSLSKASPLGIALSVVEGVGQFISDPTEWTAKTLGKNYDPSSKFTNIAARSANVITGGERGFMNAVFNGLKWLPFGLPFVPPVGGLVAFAAGFIVNLIGREAVLTFIVGIKTVLNSIGKFVMTAVELVKSSVTSTIRGINDWFSDIVTAWQERSDKKLIKNKIVAPLNKLNTKINTFYSLVGSLSIKLDIFKNILFIKIDNIIQLLTTSRPVKEIFDTAVSTYKTLLEEPIKAEANIIENGLKDVSKIAIANVKAALNNKTEYANNHNKSLVKDLSRSDKLLKRITDDICRLADYIGTDVSVTPMPAVNEIIVDAAIKSTPEAATAFAKEFSKEKTTTPDGLEAKLKLLFNE